jgi:AhpC/TSA family/Disulphide bond corrector protein DsbC
LPQLKSIGIKVASITYDSRETLKAFSDANHIEYPMLSDPDSQAIRAFGIFNTNIPPDHKMMYGIPWPGEYLLAPDGTVRDKLFLRNYEHRASATQIVLRQTVPATRDSNSVVVTTEPLEATITLSTDRCFPAQELGVALRIKLKPGWHVYGKPLPANYQAMELVFDSSLVDSLSLNFPPVTQMHLPVLGETLPVYTGEIEAFGKVGIRWSPPMPAKFLLALGEIIQPGSHKLGGTLRFQACSDAICEAPQEVCFELPFTILAGVPPAPQSAG